MPIKVCVTFTKWVESFQKFKNYHRIFQMSVLFQELFHTHSKCNCCQFKYVYKSFQMLVSIISFRQIMMEKVPYKVTKQPRVPNDLLYLLFSAQLIKETEKEELNSRSFDIYKWHSQFVGFYGCSKFSRIKNPPNITVNALLLFLVVEIY